MCHLNILRNCNKSLDILGHAFYLLPLCRWTNRSRMNKEEALKEEIRDLGASHYTQDSYCDVMLANLTRLVTQTGILDHILTAISL